MDPRTTEDCLFLDVVVPQKIFDHAKQHTDHGKRKSFVPKHKLAPVLVWIYGGGYVEGEKSSNNPTGLIERSQVVSDGIVYVALNYRVSLKLGVSQILNNHLILAFPLARRIWLAFRRCNHSQRNRKCRAS
jgi:carboxylesterase type B